VRDESRLITESVSAVRGDDSGAYYTAARPASRSSGWYIRAWTYGMGAT